jgi:sucrose-phosphate synthase
LQANRSSAAAPSDKDARLEYLSWRVWGMRRKREVVLAEQSNEQEEDEEALDSCSEKSVDGDLETARLVLPESDTSPVLDSQRKLRVQVSSMSESSLDDATVSDYPSQDYMDLDNLDISSYRADNQRLYVIMISMHGLVRGESMELGKDADTGGQVSP